VCKSENFTDTRPPPTGSLRPPSHRALCSPRCGTDGYLIHPPTDLATPSNLEGELWLLLNLIDLHVKLEQKTGNIKLDNLGLRFKVHAVSVILTKEGSVNVCCIDIYYLRFTNYDLLNDWVIWLKG